MKAVIISIFLLFASQVSFADSSALEAAKADLVAEAKKYMGKGDPDGSIQKRLMPFVNKVLENAPRQLPVEERLDLLEGAWKQVWGAYDYRNNDRGVDPSLQNPDEIYQVVSSEGYYYNVAPFYKSKRDRTVQITLLRGEYKLDKKDEFTLKVRFTKFPGVEPRPENINIWELPELEELGALENRVTIVPTFVVRLFFGRGKLKEIYTDDDIRITLTSNKRSKDQYLYVFERMKK